MEETESFQNYVHAFSYFSGLNEFFVRGGRLGQDFPNQQYRLGASGDLAALHLKFDIRTGEPPESDLLPEVYRLNLPELYLVPLNYCRERVNMYVAGS